MERGGIIGAVVFLAISIAAVNSAPCQSNVTTTWVVDDMASAAAMAEGVNCSGGVFSVEWRGQVVLDREIHVSSGSYLVVAGVDPGASEITGTGDHRLFSVTNASLNVSNLSLTNGNAANGGAISAERSTLWFEHTEFSNNTAAYDGGAVFVSDGSNATWQADAWFSGNRAGGNGGVVYVSAGSSATWVSESSYSNNSAGYSGGVVFVHAHSNVTWQGESYFSANTAGSGGGVIGVYNKSIAAWQEKTSFFKNSAGDDGGVAIIFYGSSATWQAGSLLSYNTAGRSGGVVHVEGLSNATWQAGSLLLHNSAGDDGGVASVYHGSSVNWQASSSFSNNSATFDGGVVFLHTRSTASWQAHSSFFNNSAGDDGGVLCVYISSSAMWRAESSFMHNTGGGDGGVVDLWNASSVVWGGESTFFNNRAIDDGGVASVLYGSSATWQASSLFLGNDATDNGGAVFIELSSNGTWQGNSSFSDNTAGRWGGAVYVENLSNAKWKAGSSFSQNTAGSSGGAVTIYAPSVAEWSGQTHFAQNSAVDNGGAISILPNVFGQLPYLGAKGRTIFFNNSCGGSGGAMAIVGGMEGDFLTEKVLLTDNSAGVSGGAIFVTGAGKGLEFIGLRFQSNIARVGGGVYVTGSGTAVDGHDINEKQPTRFNQCIFEGNVAHATGGAVDSGAGLDRFVHSSFVGNSAQIGGALRLAGTASLANCTFVENASSDGGGSAISNIGYISAQNNTYFRDNIFECNAGTFLDYNTSSALGNGDLFNTACATSETSCIECRFEGKLPICTEQLENTISDGGHVVLETLSIQRGYWRDTNVSRVILPCYHPGACPGGKTGLNSSCTEGYEGPYCSVCREDYGSGLGHTCSKCADDDGGIVIAAVVCVLAMMTFVAFVAFMVCTEVSDVHQGIALRLRRLIPLQSVKIAIVSWQIITQFVAVANVTYPGMYQRFLNVIDVINFDITWILSAECMFDVDFHDKLIVMTVGPLIAVAVLGTTYLVATKRSGGCDEEVVRVARRKHLSAFLLLTFMVYSSVSSTLFQMYACDKLDNGMNYLRADYRIECDSPKHEVLQVYAAFMIVLYTGGIPMFYATFLWNSRDILTNKVARDNDERAISISDLWKAYKPHRFYFELIDLFRRIILAGLVVFIYPNSAAQIAITIVLAGAFALASEAMAPYESQWDTWISRMGHVVIFLSMYLALLSKVEVAKESRNSQRMFEPVLVAAHAGLMLAVVVEAVVTLFSLRRVEHKYPRRRMLPTV